MTIKNSLQQKLPLTRKSTSDYISFITERFKTCKKEEKCTKVPEKETIFKGGQFALDLDPVTPFKEKQKVRKLITENGGIVSFIVTRKSNFVVTNNVEKSRNSYKTKQAEKWMVPVVSVQYIEVCVDKKKLLDPDDFVVLGKTRQTEFNVGKIVATQPRVDGVKRRAESVCDGDVEQVDYDAGESGEWVEYDVVKHSCFKKAVRGGAGDEYAVLELHVTTRSTAAAARYRVFCNRGIVRQGQVVGVMNSGRCSYADSGVVIVSYYHHQYQQLVSQGLKRVLNPPLQVVRGLASRMLIQLYTEYLLGSGEYLDESVVELVHHLWLEAVGHLGTLLAKPPDQIQPSHVEEAEGVLLECRHLLDTGATKAEEYSALSQSFYSLIPFINRQVIDNKKVLAQLQDICQLILDLHDVSECCDWSEAGHVVAKYRSLRCHIDPVDRDSGSYQDITSSILNTKPEGKRVKILNMYSVHRMSELSSFPRDIGNKQLLFHSSPVQNYVGILSRGLLLPKIVVSQFGVDRSDDGLLGSGIYFTDVARASMPYGCVSECKGSRLMLVCEVALGCSKQVSHPDPSLTHPPAGHQSVMGVRSTSHKQTSFQENEFVIYEANQQRLRYLVEYLYEGEDVITSLVESLPQEEQCDALPEVLLAKPMLGSSGGSQMPDTVESVVKSSGLLGAGGVPLPLQRVHISAQLLDLVAHVLVMQEYINQGQESIEAKFAFPLDGLAAVVGFEAFINGKHIVGEVKEKEQAHREYRQAVREGHGAYLMDEDAPDIFTVSVGNLPARCTALIKITYVTELGVEGGDITFHVPGDVAPWQKQAALDHTTQDVTQVVQVKEGTNKRFTLEACVEMPFEIRSIRSPTHNIRQKKTDCHAVVKLATNSVLDTGFQLLIGKRV